MLDAESVADSIFEAQGKEGSRDAMDGESLLVSVQRQ